MFKSSKNWLAIWWQGELQENTLEEVFMDPPNERYNRHWTATIVRVLVFFYLKYWKWIWGFAVSVLGVYVAYTKI